MAAVVVDGNSLTLADVVSVARELERELAYPEYARKGCEDSRALKLELISTGQPVYGVTTGFGDSVTTQIAPAKAARLQLNMIRYHLNGTGPWAPDEVVRATLLIRANCLARGNSGVQPAVVERLLDLLRHDVLPRIPERGSVGASGDLVPLCYVASTLIGEGQVRNCGHFDAFIHEQRPHKGQQDSAALLSALLDGSALSLPHSQVVDLNDPLDGGDHGTLRRSIQDRYSIRCAPHVNGVLRDTLDWVDRWLEIEINASTDNPLFDAGAGNVHSGGNFYAGHVVQAMDSLKVAVANIADLLDRQLELLVDEKFNVI